MAFGRILELALYLAFALGWIVACRKVGLLRRDAAPSKWAVVGVVVLAIGVQVGTVGQYVFPQRVEFFPLARFAMFSSKPSDRFMVDRISVRYDDGSMRYADPAKLFYSLRETGQFTRFRFYRSLLIERSTSGEILRHLKTLDGLLVAIARQQQRKLRVDASPVQVDFIMEEWSVRRGEENKPQSKRLLHSVLITNSDTDL